MNSELVKVDVLDNLVRTKNIQGLLEELQKSNQDNIKENKTSKERRVEKWRGRKEDFSVEKLVELRRKMSGFVTKKFATISLSEPRVLTAAEAKALMDEYLDAEAIRDALDARRSEAKRMVFDSLTASNISEKMKNPEHHNGSIEVPELGKKFCREGTGKTDPILNPVILKELLTDEEWEQITTLTIIPEQREYTIDESKLAEFLHAHPRKVEAVRQALVPGEWKAPRFQVRDL